MKEIAIAYQFHLKIHVQAFSTSISSLKAATHDHTRPTQVVLLATNESLMFNCLVITTSPGLDWPISMEN